MKNTSPNKSGNPESLKNNRKSLKVPLVGQELLRVFYRLCYLQSCDSSDQ